METTRKLQSRVDLARLYITSALKNSAYRATFDHIEAFCIFIGYPRSGHTLIGSLLDAHRNMVVALELDALRLVRRGFSKYQLYYLLLENSHAASATGRHWTGYSYQVPNQWQGRYETIKVIGDKKGGESSKHLLENITLIDQLQRTVGVKVKAIHVVRNPYDNISTMLRRGNATTLTDSINQYFMMADAVAKIQSKPSTCEVLTVNHEAFIREPIAGLQVICQFLGVDAPEDYLRDCATIVFENPHKTRDDVQWDQASLAQMERQIQKYDFLADYSY